MKKFCLALILLLCVAFSTAQNKMIIDSLLKARSQAKEDTSKIKLTFDICWQYMQKNPDTALILANEGIELSKKSNYDFGLGKGYILKGIQATIVGNYDEAINNYLLSKKIKEQQRDSLGIASIFNNIGNIHLNKGNYKEAINFYLQSLKIEEKHGDPERLGSSYMNLGGVFYKLQKHNSALPYFQKCFEITKGISPAPQYLASAYNNLGKIFLETNKVDSAQFCFNKALEIALSLGDTYAEAGGYEGLANILEAKNDYQGALNYYLRAEKMFDEIGDADALTSVMSNVAEAYANLNQYDNAIKKCLESMDLAREIGSKKSIVDNAKILTICYEEKGNLSEALKYEKINNVYTDSLLNETSNHQIEELRTEYETEKKEADNQLLTKANKLKDVAIEKSRNEKLFLLSIIALLIVAGGFALSRFKLKQQQAHQKELMQQQELRSKAVIEAEERERQRIGKDLHDGVGQLLSAAKMNVSNIVSASESMNENQKLNLKNAIDLLDESVKEVRTISHNMMPNMLIRSGLSKAVREFIDKIASAGQLKIELQTVGLDQRLDGNTENILFRVLQEIVANIIKHAKATEVSIQLIRHENELNLLVEDNGKGFDLSKINDMDGIGLKNIQSRIQYLNGSVDFDSQPGRGTIVNIEIPLGSSI